MSEPSFFLVDLFQYQINRPITILLINLGIYLLAERFFVRMGRKGWFHPVFGASLLIFLLIRFTPLDSQIYNEHSELLKMLLAPFTVALAIPLSKQLSRLRQLAGPLIIGLLLGGFFAVSVGMGLALWVGGTHDVVLSISTKAVTTAVALVVGDQLGAIMPLVAAVVIVSGIFGAIVGPVLCRMIGVKDPRAVGFAMGVNAHAGGTARAFELDLTMGVYASLGMCLGGRLHANTGAFDDSINALNFMFEKQDLIKIANQTMPFGKYSGRRLIDLPEPYLLWFSDKGFPNGELGRLLALTLEIKINGLEGLINPLKQQ